MSTLRRQFAVRRLSIGVALAAASVLGCTSGPSTGRPEPSVATPPTSVQAVVTVVEPTTTLAEVALTAAVPTTTSSSSSTIAVPNSAVADATSAPAPSVPSLPAQQNWLAIAETLGPLGLPSDCPLPLGQPGLMPNSDRSYRGGVHQGIDFVCLESGHIARTPLAGRVLLAVSQYVDPSEADRNAILDEAQKLGRTPLYVLQFLFGRFVVLDHGFVDGVGHVVTIYAHLESVDPAVTPGTMMSAGATIGLIGNSGTETAAAGGTRPQSIHLHWELHIDDIPFPEGLDTAATAAVVGVLFAQSTS